MKKVYLQNPVLDMPKFKNSRFAAVVVVVAWALTGCGKTDTDETAGQKIDAAIEKAKQAASQAHGKSESAGAEIKAKTEEAFGRAGQVLKDTAEKSESSTKAAAEKTIQKLDDMAITTAISAEFLKDKEIQGLKINVDTKNGAVVLTGEVPTENLRVKAEAAAKKFNGVQSVDNRLLVKG